MPILILSANTGGGHNSAAAAIREELASRGIESEIQDGLKYLSEQTSKFISWGHSYIYKNLPGLFGKAYAHEEKHPSPLLYDSIALGAERFYKYVKGKDFTAIICVHVFSAMLVTETKRRYGLDVPFYFVATDYTCSPGVADIDPTIWFTPDELLNKEFTDGGIPPERLVASGIPIRREFYQKLNQAEARQMLHLPPSGPVVLLCCGSIGCGHINRMTPQLEAIMPEDATLVIVCGHNVRAYRKLKERAAHHTVVVGFTNRIAQYMAAADVCISKPGGLSTTEMLAVGVPMVLWLAVPGCESRNMEFLVNQQMAVGSADWNDVVHLTGELLRQPEQLAVMRRRLQDHPMPVAAEKLVDCILHGQ